MTHGLNPGWKCKRLYRRMRLQMDESGEQDSRGGFMLTRRKALGAIAGLAGLGRLTAADERYSGPVPPKKDVLYLVHADTLIETEVATASQSASKNDQLFIVQ